MSGDDNIITCTESQHITQGIGLDMLKATVVSTLSTFVLTTLLLTVIIGCVCGYQVCKKKYYDLQSSNPIAIYEDVIPQSSVRQQETSFELKSNVAYGSNPSK